MMLYILDGDLLSIVRPKIEFLLSLARLSKPKSTTHDFAQAIMKKLLKQKINYPIS